MQTVNVQPWAESQGEFVTINVEDFDPAIHKRLPGDDTPLPGPFDALARPQLVELLVVEFRTSLESVTDDEIRQALTQAHAKRVGETRAAVAQEREATDADRLAGLDRDHDGNPGGSFADDDTLLGSSVLDAHVVVGDNVVLLGGVVIAAFRESCMTVPAWNDQEPGDREARLSATIERLAADPAAFAAEVEASYVVTPGRENGGGGDDRPAAPTGIHAMTVKQLKAFAAEKAIDLGDAVRKDDIVAAIELALEAAAQPGA